MQHNKSECSIYNIFNELFLETRDKSYRIAYNYVRNQEDAYDCVQDAYLRAYQKIGQFQGTSQLQTWFHRILVNICIDFIRKRQRRSAILSSPEKESDTGDTIDLIAQAEDKRAGASPESNITRKEIADKLFRSLEELSGHQKSVFILKHYHDMSLKEISDILSISEGTTKSHLHRAVMKLKNLLGDQM